MAPFSCTGHTASQKEWGPCFLEDRVVVTQTPSQLNDYLALKMAKTNHAVFTNHSVQADCSPHRRRQAKNHQAVGVHNLCIIQAVKCPSKHAKGDLSNPSSERPSQTLLIRSPFTRASGLAGDNKAKWISAHWAWEWLRRIYSIHQS